MHGPLPMKLASKLRAKAFYVGLISTPPLPAKFQVIIVTALAYATNVCHHRLHRNGINLLVARSSRFIGLRTVRYILLSWDYYGDSLRGRSDGVRSRS